MIFLANLIEHDAVVGDNCHISTASVINGDVRVGNGVFFGSNATAKNGVIIEQNSLIPMASSVKLGGGGAALKSRILEFQEVPKIFFAIGDVI
ncbi:DapH/DapD/GlmU-related protein [Campylobacter sp.]|uniref:DapH/DapD/GlmU-related protein n=1 Tax=Campylobacter sp. TaxID=205 RepID=UPI002A55A0DA|nr:DapH/DapD/GlmU-related protein [Campylobacter sp.]MDD7090217.1 DapH/DapD/GlmU-related protein [Campylobacteraceae bacterium]MDY5284944.1 DapH/DapD/GlmU-related protein [Campylobacter sp.]